MMRRLLSAVLAVIMIVCLLPLNVMQAHAASAMKASDEVVLYLKTMEGFTAVPRWDYVQWTVGFGNRCPDEHLERYLREGIPIEEANALFLEQLVYFEDEVNDFMDRNGLTFTQNQFDAVLSLTYNCGAAWLYGDSQLVNAIIKGTRGNMLVALMSHRCTAGGEYLQGLMRRRITEAEMYLYGRYNTQIPANYAYVFYDAGEGTASGVAQAYDCNLSAVPIVTAEREGYTFLGWYTAKNGGVKVTYLDENLHEMTLYAHWAEGDGNYSGDYDEVEDGGVAVTVTCDVLNVRSGPGTGYPVVASLTQGSTVVITQTTTAGGHTWGKYDKGWISLEYTDYNQQTTTPPSGGDSGTGEDFIYEAPVYATIVGKSTITVYNGPHTGYPKVGSLNENDEVLIVETYKMFTTWWGRLENGGWICLDRYVLLHNNQMLAHSVVVEVTNSYLNVRSGPGTSYGWLDSLNRGDQVEILAVEVVEGDIWGRFTGGWVSLEYTDFDESKLEQYWHHSFGDWYTVTNSTCVTVGQQRHDCRYCDAYETRDLELTGHSYGQWYVSQEATCTENGQERRDCEYCDAYETRATEKIGHELGEWYVSLEATCVENGQERRDCANCDYFETRETECAGHSLGDWYVTVEPTYTQEGEERRDCVNCDYYETRVMGTAEHDFGDWEMITQPSCEEPGAQQRVCAQCGYVETQQIDPLGHEFNEWAELLPATCTEPGVLARGCQTCGKTEFEEQAPLGHSFDQWVTLKEATCTEDGLQTATCLVCGFTEEAVISAHGHSMNDWYTAREATCTEDGILRRDCHRCDYSETEKISATGHVVGQWYVAEESTCSKAGQMRRDCQNCDHFESAVMPKQPHSYGDWYISVEPTYTADGEERRDCENCDAYETRVKEFDGEVIIKVIATVKVNSLNVRSGPGTGYSWVGTVTYGSTHQVYEQVTVAGGKVWGRIDKGWICLTGYTTLKEVVEVIGHTHTFGDWYAITQATCTEAGKERRDCAGCTHYETRTVSAVGHSFGDWYAITQATCTEDGQQRRDCAECGHYETQTVSAVGHSFGDWYTVREATPEENGLERRECENCDHYEEREVEYVANTVTKVYATITAYSLNVRSGPGSNYGLVGYVLRGTTHEVYEQVTLSDGKVWGRIDKGWICLTGYTTLKTVEEEEEPVHTHTMSNWYTVIAATCTEAGFMRRDCRGCDYYQQKSIEATGHSLGEWYAVEEGLERRECANCDYAEERQVEVPVTTITRVYATITVYSLNVRSGAGSGYGVVGYVLNGTTHEVFEQVTLSDGKVWGRIDKGWICLTGYTTLEEVTEEVEQGDAGQNAMKVVATVLNVRAGAGSDYQVVTSLAYGTEVKVLEQVTINGVTWARIAEGWVSMAYLA